MKILDCTLRDGGYYTNWNFDRKLSDLYFKSLNNLPVDYLEVGYRCNPGKDYYGEYYYCPPYVLERIKSISDKKLVIILDEKNVKLEEINELLKPCIGIITMIRFAIDPKNFKRALLLAEEVKKLGFEVGFNVMYMSTWRDESEFLDSIKYIEGITDYFYMVDSFGGVFPKDVIDTIDIVRSKTNVPLGFHGHNNLELALVNSLTAIDNGVEMIDATITGMGRGAGNLKTELLLTVLNSTKGLEVDFNALSQISGAFELVQKEFEWGTNIPYMVSGANSLPQKEVMEWVSKRYYSYNSIIRALHNKKEGVKDNLKFEILKHENFVDNILIIGGGESVLTHIQALLVYLEQNPDITIIHASSKNAKPFAHLINKQIFCLVGNEGHRLEDVFFEYKDFQGICILPPYPREMGTYVPASVEGNTFELENVNFTNLKVYSHTSLAIQTALNLGATNVLVTGYDGYSGDKIAEKEQELFIENEKLFQEGTSNGVEFYSLTPSKYKSLKAKSIYGLLI
jgi:4-hydroxy 2-oxovalerate aldolase